jgi:HD-GYP domain-containing protein (c-di-GMP phosphodiesterase class II)
MTTDRPYRKALLEEVALEEIRSNAGTQFDPEIAAVFLEMYPFETAPAADETRRGSQHAVVTAS